MREPSGASESDLLSSGKEVTTVRWVALTCGALIGGHFDGCQVQVDVDLMSGPQLCQGFVISGWMARCILKLYP